MVPSLQVAHQLKFKENNQAWRRFRFVTLEGEVLQRSGVFSFDVGGNALGGGVAAAATAKAHKEQHEELLRRAEGVRLRLQNLDALEVGPAEKAFAQGAALVPKFNLNRQSVLLPGTTVYACLAGRRQRGGVATFPAAGASEASLYAAAGEAEGLGTTTRTQTTTTTSPRRRGAQTPGTLCRPAAKGQGRS